MDFKTTQKWAKIFGILTLGGLLARCFASSIAIAVGTASFFIGLLGLAAVVLLFFFSYGTREEPEPYAAFDTIELAEHMQQIMNLNMEDVTSIKASPVQECVLLTATLADGSTKTFVMSKSEEEEEEGSTSFIAIN